MEKLQNLPRYTLIDSVIWNGGRSFDELPFSDCDALILSDVIYFDIFPEGCEGKTLRELIGAAPVDDPDLVKRLGGGLEAHVPFIRSVAASERYGPLIVTARADEYDAEKSIQFCAAVFSKPGLFNFIAFRGTDDSIAGWKEDFMISFTRTTAQRMAVDFAAAHIDPSINNYIAGHSKGANLALYATALLPDSVRKSLTKTYTLDGPGFCPDVLDLSLLDAVQDRTVRIIPEYSVIGKLFEPKIRNTLIIRSNEKKIMQHELLSWCVTPYGPDEAESEDPAAEELNDALKSWIEDVSSEEREKFIDDLFSSLSVGGAETMTEVTKSNIGGIDDILISLVSSSSDAKKTASVLSEKLVFGNLFKGGGLKNLIAEIKKDELVTSVLLILAGILISATSNFILDATSVILFFAFTLLQFALTLRKFIKYKHRWAAVRERVYIDIILAVICVCLVFKEGATFLIGSGIFSAIALVLGVQASVRLSSGNGMRLRGRILSICELVACALFGIAFLLVPQSKIFGIAFSAGLTLVLDGIARICFIVYDNKGKFRKKTAVIKKD